MKPTDAQAETMAAEEVLLPFSLILPDGSDVTILARDQEDLQRRVVKRLETR